MEPDAQGRMAVTVVTLRPGVRYGGERRPDAAEQARLHHEAHANCFIANSVKSEVRCEPVSID
jgi:organic hydroperoxide reductase OsmC/OhrA